MKKILVLYTGGTIGMDYTANGLSLVSGLFKSQLNSIIPIFNDIQIDLIEYDNIIDSSDISLSIWIKIINDIVNHYDKYHGFIVIHGTDTMAYTASILAFALRGLNKPVILTGAQLPLVNKRSDGYGNLINAIYSALQDDLHEVAIAFNRKLFRGCRAQKISTNRFLAFDSVDEEPLAEFGINISWYKRRWLKTGAFNFTPIIPQAVNVLDLSLRPGYTTDFIADVLKNRNDIQGVVLQTYGSGTIPMHNATFVQALKNACSNGVIIVGVTQVIEGHVSDNYINSQLNSIGVINGKDMTPEAALAKLTILLSVQQISLANIKVALATNLVGELTEHYE
mgnify:CR=1 FL=1